MGYEEPVLVETTIVTPPAGHHTTPEEWNAWHWQLRVMGTEALDKLGYAPIDSLPEVPDVDDDDEFFEGAMLTRQRRYRAGPFELVLDDQIDTGDDAGGQEVSVRRTLYVYVEDSEIQAGVFSAEAPKVWAKLETLREWALR